MRNFIIRRLTNAVFSSLNAFIIAASAIGAAVMDSSGMAAFPLVLGGILLFFSVIYDLKYNNTYKSEVLNNNEYDDIKILISGNKDALNPILSKILLSLTSLKNIDKSKYSNVTDYMFDVVRFEKMIPELVRKYREGSAFVRSRKYGLNEEIETIRIKMNSTQNSNAKVVWEKTLKEKEELRDEIDKIACGVEECESTLNLILSAMQKIEAIIQSSEMSDVVTGEDAKKIEEQLEVFSDCLKNVSNIKLVN